MRAKCREVLEYFLELEATKPAYASRRLEFEAWKKLDDDSFFSLVKRFGNEQEGLNPLLTWTVGTQKTLFHNYNKRVSSWCEGIVPLEQVYTMGINQSMKGDLSLSSWNLERFTRSHAQKYEEFQLQRHPGRSSIRIVVVKHRKIGKIGEYEIIDGAHRAIAMIHQGVRETPAYIARLKRPWY